MALVKTRIKQHKVEDNISYNGNHTSAVGEIYITFQHSLLQFLKNKKLNIKNLHDLRRP
jgi:hypothetical protein